MDSLSHETKTIFSIISTYFVDFYYNVLYNHAVSEKEKGNYGSVTDAYRMLVSKFAESFSCKPPEHLRNKVHTYDSYYKRVIKQIYEYHQKWTGFHELRITSYLDKLAEQFVPEEKIKFMTNPQKEQFVQSALIQCVIVFSRNIIRDYLPFIIDNRLKGDEGDLLQPLISTFDRLLISQRNEIFSDFLDAMTGNKTSEISADITRKARNYIKTLTEKNCVLQKELVENKKKFMFLAKQIELRDDEIETLQNKLLEAQRKIHELKTNPVQYTPQPVEVPTRSPITEHITTQQSPSQQPIKVEEIDSEESDSEEIEDEHIIGDDDFDYDNWLSEQKNT